MKKYIAMLIVLYAFAGVQAETYTFNNKRWSDSSESVWLDSSGEAASSIVGGSLVLDSEFPIETATGNVGYYWYVWDSNDTSSFGDVSLKLENNSSYTFGFYITTYYNSAVNNTFKADSLTVEAVGDGNVNFSFYANTTDSNTAELHLDFGTVTAYSGNLNFGSSSSVGWVGTSLQVDNLNLSGTAVLKITNVGTVESTKTGTTTSNLGIINTTSSNAIVVTSSDFSITGLNGTGDMSFKYFEYTVDEQTYTLQNNITLLENTTRSVYNGSLTSSTGTTLSIVAQDGAMQAFRNTASAITSLEIQSGAQIDLSSAENAAITVKSGGQLSAISLYDVDETYVSEVGTLTASSLTLEAGAILLFDLDSTTSGDSIAVDTLTASLEDGETITIEFVYSFDIVDGDYVSVDLITFDSVEGLTSDSFVATGISVDGAFTLDTTSGVLSYTYGAVPESSTYALIFGVLSLGFVYYRKRK